jgi:coenzyme F420-0:L-glutamate ligase/coenzyme F420-1:gamma-L-glutamate ligase
VLECWGSDKASLHYFNQYGPCYMPAFAQLTRKERAFIRAARLAHLATADARGQPHVIPICFVFDRNEFFSPIDEKPKRTSPRLLKRLKNISENPKICLLVDRYEEDWQKLAHVLVRGTAKILLRGKRHDRAVRLLRRKYPQYRSMALEQRPIIRISPTRAVSWSFAKRRTASRKPDE